MWCATPYSPLCVVAPSTTATAVPNANSHTCADAGVTTVDDRRQFRQDLGRAEFIAGLLDRLCGRGGAEVCFEFAFEIGELLEVDDDALLQRALIADLLSRAPAETLAAVERVIEEAPLPEESADLHHTAWPAPFLSAYLHALHHSSEDGSLAAHIELATALYDAAVAVLVELDTGNLRRSRAGEATLHPSSRHLAEQAARRARTTPIHPRLLALVELEIRQLLDVPAPTLVEVRHAV